MAINYDEVNGIGSIIPDDTFFVSFAVVVTDNGTKYFQWLYGDSIDEPIPLDECDEPVLGGAECFIFSFNCCWSTIQYKRKNNSIN